MKRTLHFVLRSLCFALAKKCGVELQSTKYKAQSTKYKAQNTKDASSFILPPSSLNPGQTPDFPATHAAVATVAPFPAWRGSQG